MHPGGLSAEEFHRLMKTDDDAWSTATLVGFQSDGEHLILELRDCACCHSCVSRHVPPSELFEKVERDMEDLVREIDRDEWDDAPDTDPSGSVPPLMHAPPRREPRTLPELAIPMAELIRLPVDGRKG